MGRHQRNFSWMVCMSMAFAVVSLFINQSIAIAKVDVVLHSDEGMKEHNSGEPRRLVHDVVAEELTKGNLFHIVNTENTPQPTKPHNAPYHIAANLIAFNASEKMPVRVSLCLQLVESSSSSVVMTSDRSFSIDAQTIQSALKLKQHEFNRSNYGLALDALSRDATKIFQQKAAAMKLKS